MLVNRCSVVFFAMFLLNCLLDMSEESVAVDPPAEPLPENGVI